MAKAEVKQSAIERARARLKGMKEKRGGGEYAFGFLEIPENSKMVVRVYKGAGKDPGEFYHEVQQHSGLGPKRAFALCPKSFDEECPICEQHSKLHAQGMKKVKVNKEQGIAWLKKNADGLRPRDRFFMNANRMTEDGPVQTGGNNKGKPAEKPEMLAVGPQIFTQILEAFAEEEADISGNFWEKKNRYDFLIKRTGKGLNTEYVVTPTRKYAKVDTDEQEAQLHDLTEAAGKPLEASKLLALMNGEEAEEEEVDEEGADEETDDEEEAPKSKKSKKAADEDDEDEEEASDESDDDEEADESDDDDEEEKPAKKKSKAKADDDEEEDDEVEEVDEDDEVEEVDDEDEEEKPAKAKKKAADEDDDEEESDDEEASDDDDEESDDEEADESDDDDEEEKPAKKKVTPKAATKSAKGKPAAKGKPKR